MKKFSKFTMIDPCLRSPAEHKMLAGVLNRAILDLLNLRGGMFLSHHDKKILEKTEHWFTCGLDYDPDSFTFLFICSILNYDADKIYKRVLFLAGNPEALNKFRSSKLYNAKLAKYA